MRFIFLALLFLFTPLLQAEPLPVLVSIAPQKFLVDKIGGETTKVLVLVPENMSSHSYEPTLREMITAKQAVVWFCIGEGFETILYDSFRSSMPLVDAKENLDLLQTSCTHCCHSPFDPHIWLSCSLLKKQAVQIAGTLSSLVPEHKEIYARNLEALLLEIEKTDQTITELLAPHHGKTMLVAHPAFGYFCHEYGLVQLPVEFNGKEPSPKQLTTLIESAKKSGVKTIFTQKQYPIKGAARIQEALQISTFSLNPYAENVLENLKFIAQAVASHG